MALNSKGLGFVITARDMASGVFQKVGARIGGLAGAARNASAQIRESGAAMESMGRKMMLVGAAGVGALGLASSAAAKYGKSVAEIQTIADEAQFSLASIRDITQQMSTLYEGDLTMQAKALYQAISAGATSASDATSLMHAANKLSIAGIANVEESIDGLTNVINAYNLSYDEAANVSDAFFTAVRVGKTTIPGLAKFIGNVAPTAAAAGVSVDELSSVIAALTASGVKTRISMTAMKAALANIIKPSAQATKAAKRLGIDFNVAALESKGWVGFLKDIKGAVGDDKEAMGSLFGSVEAFNAMMVLTGKGAGKFNTILEAMKNKAGSTDKAYSIMSKTASFTADLFKSNLAVAFTKVGEAIEPVTVALFLIGTRIMQAFSNLPKPVQQVIVGMFGAASVFLLVAGAVIALVGAIVGLVAIGKPVLIALAAAVAIMNWMAVAAGVAALAVAGFWVAIKENVGGLGTFLEETSAKVTLAWQALSQLFESGTLSGSVGEEMNKASNSGLKTFVVEVWGWGMKIKAFLTGIKTGFTDAVGGMESTFHPLVQALRELGASFGLVSTKGDEAGAAFDAAGGSGVSIGEALASAFRIIVIVITAVVDAITGFVQGFRDNAPDVMPIIDSIVDSISEIGTALGMVDDSTEGSSTMWQTVGGVIGGVVAGIAWVVRGLAGVISFVATIIGSYIEAIVGVFNGASITIGGVIQTIIALLSGDWAGAWKGARMIVQGVLTTIISIVASFVGVIAGLIDEVGKLFGKDLGLKAGVRGIKKDMLGGLKEGLGLGPVTAAPAGLVSNAIVGPDTATSSTAAAGRAPASAPAGAALASANNAGMMSALREGAAGIKLPPNPPVNINMRAQLDVDGQNMAEVVERYSTAGGNRNFGPTPTPA